MAVLATPALAAIQAYGRHNFPGMMGGWGWGIGIVGMLFWLALFVLIVVLIWRLLERGGRGGSPFERAGETPLEILKKRYARGEIDRDEFERMKRDLA